MSDIKEDGFAGSVLLEQLANALSSLSEKEKKAEINKTKAIFEIVLKNGDKEQSWVVDLKKEGTLVKGKPAGVKPDVTLIMDDSVFMDLAAGKINGQKAFMTGKLKTKGNMMLATKLEGILKLAQNKQKAKL